MAKSAKELVCRGVKVNHKATCVQYLPIRSTKYRPSAGRQDCIALPRQRIQHLSLQISESELTVTLKKVTNRTTDTPLYFLVAINKPPTDLLSQLPADGGFATSWHSHQRNCMRRSSATQEYA
jgi:hypothetical protein